MDIFDGKKVPKISYECYRFNGKECFDICCAECLFSREDIEQNNAKYRTYIEEHDLTKITKPFGLLTEYTQERLKEINNGNNIQLLNNNLVWHTIFEPEFTFKNNVYRLNPEWKKEAETEKYQKEISELRARLNELEKQVKESR